MPFQSEAQRRYMHARHPEIAKRWEHDQDKASKRKLPGHKTKAIPTKAIPTKAIPKDPPNPYRKD